MKKLLERAVLFILSVPSWLTTNITLAAETPTEYPVLVHQTTVAELPAHVSTKITSISQLSDVQPHDWAFQALQSLIDEYDIANTGYLNSRFQGNRVLTRYEFAMGLSNALNHINSLIAVGDRIITKAELATLQKLQADFAIELATLRGRVDNLNVQIDLIEAQQFSTTTKLTGDGIFSITGAFGNKKAVSSNLPAVAESVDENITFAQRVILNFETSFTGKDALTTSLYASNLPNLAAATGTQMTRLGFEQDAPDTENILGLYFLQYSFPVFKDKGTIVIEPTAGFLSDFTDTINPLLDDLANGSISVFGLRNPVYRYGLGGGAGLTYNFNKAAGFSVAYLATDANDPNPGAGLFNGSYGAIAQLTLQPSETILLGLTYVRSYNALDLTEVGSTYSNDPFDGANTSANSYGVEANFRASSKFSIGGWVGFTHANAENGPHAGAEASIFNYAVTLAFPDLGKVGSLAGFVIGQPPKVTANDISFREDDNTSLHLEAFYRYQATDNISITPGFIVITNPEHNENNDTLYLGTIRTSFTF